MPRGHGACGGRRDPGPRAVLGKRDAARPGLARLRGALATRPDDPGRTPAESIAADLWDA